MKLSEKAEVSEGTIKTAEADGEKRVFPGTLAAIARALQVSNEELLVDGQPPVKMVRVIFEMPVPFEEFQQQIHGERLLEILAKLLMIKPTIKGIERGSTKVIVEMTEDEMMELYRALKPEKISGVFFAPPEDKSRIDPVDELKAIVTAMEMMGGRISLTKKPEA